MKPSDLSYSDMQVLLYNQLKTQAAQEAQQELEDAGFQLRPKKPRYKSITIQGIVTFGGGALLMFGQDILQMVQDGTLSYASVAGATIALLGAIRAWYGREQIGDLGGTEQLPIPEFKAPTL